MSKRNDGGPVFPCEQGHIPDGTWNQTFEPGMTLRDYFAAKAMQSLLPQFADVTSLDYFSGSVAFVTARAYAVADSMLKARTA